MNKWLVLAYIFYVIAYIVYALVGFYHLREYSYEGDASKIVMYIYSALSIVLIVVTLFLMIGFYK